ncbi:hypothetical protein RJ639_042604 [Escallonia herrerae]|uniref:S-protein homolog n=1 Tax=Escallonia herrerae TaxID=1293975 RepID=A0AA88WGN6_9ASTE|nr:hypothetical protein RJ639_042604 [Escallonia herrerae]
MSNRVLAWVRRPVQVTASSYLLPVLALCLISTTSAHVMAPHYEVHVVNALPYEAQFRQVHCASKDDDIGYHTLYLGDEIHWRFRVGLFPTTFFFCHFWWNAKDKSFVVFQKDSSVVCERQMLVSTFYCYWYVRDDGFYLSNYYTNNSAIWEKKPKLVTANLHSFVSECITQCKDL